MSDTESSEGEHVDIPAPAYAGQPTKAKKPTPVKALAALAKAREARAKQKAEEKRMKEEEKKKKEEAVKLVSSLRKPKEPMPKPVVNTPVALDIPVNNQSNAELVAMIAKLNEKLEKKSKKKVIIESDSSSEEEIIVKKPKAKKTVTPATDPEFEAWKMDKERRMAEQSSKDKEQQLRLDLKKLFSKY
jgi:hypothetical protein